MSLSDIKSLFEEADKRLQLELDDLYDGDKSVRPLNTEDEEDEWFFGEIDDVQDPLPTLDETAVTVDGSIKDHTRHRGMPDRSQGTTIGRSQNDLQDPLPTLDETAVDGSKKDYTRRRRMPDRSQGNTIGWSQSQTEHYWAQISFSKLPEFDVEEDVGTAADLHKFDTLGEVFDRLDRNGDGMLERDDLEDLFLQSAENIRLKTDQDKMKKMIRCAIDVLMEDVNSDEATHFAEASFESHSMLRSSSMASIPRMRSLNRRSTSFSSLGEASMQASVYLNDAMNRYQFIGLFQRHPDLLTVFSSDRRRLAAVHQQCKTRDSEQEELEEEENEQVWMASWWANHRVNLVWFAIYLAATCLAFATNAYAYAQKEDAIEVMGACLVVARGSAQCLNLNCNLILLPMAKHFMTYLRLTKARHFFPVNALVDIHKLLGVAILFWTVCHVSAHACNYYRIAESDEDDLAAMMVGNPDLPPDVWGRWKHTLFQKRAGITGILMIICVLVAYPLTLVRRKHFNLFWNSHHLLLVMLVLMCFHDSGKTVFWLALPLALYLTPRFLRETSRNKTRVVNAYIKQGGALCLRVEKPKSWDGTLSAGMYAMIKVPHISRWEWHPFTLTSAPSDPFLEFHIRNSGDFTQKLHSCVHHGIKAENKGFPHLLNRLSNHTYEQTEDSVDATQEVDWSEGESSSEAVIQVVGRNNRVPAIQQKGLLAEKCNTSIELEHQVVIYVDDFIAANRPSKLASKSISKSVIQVEGGDNHVPAAQKRGFAEDCDASIDLEHLVTIDVDDFIAADCQSKWESKSRLKSVVHVEGGDNHAPEAQKKNFSEDCNASIELEHQVVIDVDDLIAANCQSKLENGSSSKSVTQIEGEDNHVPAAQKKGFAEDCDSSIELEHLFAIDVDDFIAADCDPKLAPDSGFKSMESLESGTLVEAAGLTVNKTDKHGQSQTMIQELEVYVDGPFGASSQGFSDYPILMLIGAGIGVTPMISVLKDLLVNPGTMQRVYFYWTVRDRDAFEWFSDLMDKVYLSDKKHILQIRHFLTSVKDDDRDIGAVLLNHARRSKFKADDFDLLLGQQTHRQVEVGRPDWKTELKGIKDDAKSLGHTECGIFFCGPKGMSNAIKDISTHISLRNHFQFHFNKETF